MDSGSRRNPEGPLPGSSANPYSRSMQGEAMLGHTIGISDGPFTGSSGSTPCSKQGETMPVRTKRRKVDHCHLSPSSAQTSLPPAVPPKPTSERTTRQRRYRRLRQRETKRSSNAVPEQFAEPDGPGPKLAPTSVIDDVLESGDDSGPDYHWSRKAARRARQQRGEDSPDSRSPLFDPPIAQDHGSSAPPPSHHITLPPDDSSDCYIPQSPRFVQLTPPPDYDHDLPDSTDTIGQIPEPCPEPTKPIAPFLHPDPTRRNLGAPSGIPVHTLPGRSQLRDPTTGLPAPFRIGQPAPCFPKGQWLALEAEMTRRGWSLNAKGLDHVFDVSVSDDELYQLIEHAWVETEAWGGYASGLMKPFLTRWQHYKGRRSLWLDSRKHERDLAYVGIRFREGEKLAVRNDVWVYDIVRRMMGSNHYKPRNVQIRAMLYHVVVGPSVYRNIYATIPSFIVDAAPLIPHAGNKYRHDFLSPESIVYWLAIRGITPALVEEHLYHVITHDQRLYRWPTTCDEPRPDPAVFPGSFSLRAVTNHVAYCDSWPGELESHQPLIVQQYGWKHFSNPFEDMGTDAASPKHCPASLDDAGGVSQCRSL